MTEKLLFVEDSTLVTKVMRRLFHDANAFEADFAESFEQAKSLLNDKRQQYFAAVVDLNLPDAPQGEIVDLVLGEKIPTLVLTATFDEAKKDALFQKGIVDYVVKENRYSYDYAVKLMVRLCRNHEIKIMVVDDSLVARKQISKLLQKYLFQVVEADSAKAAIRNLIDQPDIKLIVTDYHMPEIDGFELVKMIRGKYDKSDLTIIGLSGEGDAALSAKFIKHGANDFLRKPFNQEELYCRIMHNIESLEAIEKIKKSISCDYLTGTFNREYFYQLVEEKIHDCHQNQLEYGLAIIAIDDFREFNNVCGDYGDTVLKDTAQQVSVQFADYLTARLNASQLAIFVWGLNSDEFENELNNLKEDVKAIPVERIGEEHCLSISVGFTLSKQLELRQLLECCDSLVTRAQDAGKDIVLTD